MVSLGEEGGEGKIRERGWKGRRIRERGWKGRRIRERGWKGRRIRERERMEVWYGKVKGEE